MKCVIHIQLCESGSSIELVLELLHFCHGKLCAFYHPICFPHIHIHPDLVPICPLKFHFTSTAKPKLKPITSSWPGHLPQELEGHFQGRRHLHLELPPKVLLLAI